MQNACNRKKCMWFCALAVELQILGKAEFLNPGGSVKDRVALRIVQEALVRLQHLPHPMGCRRTPVIAVHLTVQTVSVHQGLVSTIVTVDTYVCCVYTLLLLGSSKKRLPMLQASGALQPGGLITEGTAGSTGVSLAMVGGCVRKWQLHLESGSYT
jgi:hypothetical protein